MVSPLRPYEQVFGSEQHTSLGESFDERSYLHTYEHEGYPHRLVITEPKNFDPSAERIFIHPGWSELVDEGVGLAYHREFAEQMPNAMVISITSTGYGQESQRLGLHELRKTTTKEMAQASVAITKHYCADGQSSIHVGTSMGSIITWKKLAILGSDTTVRHVVLNASAAVPRLRERLPRIGMRFPLSTMVDSTMEAGRMVLAGRGDELVDARNSVSLTRHDLRVLAVQGLDIFITNVKKRTIIKAIQTHHDNGAHFHVINGRNDPLNVEALYTNLDARYENFHYLPIDRKAHGIAVDAKRNARKAIRSIAARSDESLAA